MNLIDQFLVLFDDVHDGQVVTMRGAAYKRDLANSGDTFVRSTFVAHKRDEVVKRLVVNLHDVLQKVWYPREESDGKVANTPK